MQKPMQSAAPTNPPATGAAPDGFVKVEGGSTEQITETSSLIVAYSAIWIILMSFTLVTLRAVRSLRIHAERADKAVRQLSHTPR